MTPQAANVVLDIVDATHRRVQWVSREDYWHVTPQQVVLSEAFGTLVSHCWTVVLDEQKRQDALSRPGSPARWELKYPEYA